MAHGSGNRPDGAWRRARQKLEQTILKQLRTDRDVGRRVQLEHRGPWVPSGGLTLWDLEEAARIRASQAVNRAMRRHESPEAFLRRKAKLGEAA